MLNVTKKILKLIRIIFHRCSSLRLKNQKQKRKQKKKNEIIATFESHLVLKLRSGFVFVALGNQLRRGRSFLLD